ncbi:hypothetical protein ACH4OW_38030 [Streptomyces sp. NPDC017056]|uniref:hypothetical protein n=1 Tax=Streptomyces sp. NPDC017056 TaxID=3364973 RepID=UPI0037ABAFE1
MGISRNSSKATPLLLQRSIHPRHIGKVATVIAKVQFGTGQSGSPSTGCSRG